MALAAAGFLAGLAFAGALFLGAAGLDTFFLPAAAALVDLGFAGLDLGEDVAFFLAVM